MLLIPVADKKLWNSGKKNSKNNKPRASIPTIIIFSKEKNKTIIYKKKKLPFYNPQIKDWFHYSPLKNQSHPYLSNNK